METADAAGPLGATSMSESPFNPVAPASWESTRRGPAVSSPVPSTLVAISTGA